MHKVYRYVVHGKNGCEWVDVDWKLVIVGGNGLKMSESGLEVGGSRWDWMGVGGSEWEWIGLGGSMV